MVRPAFFIDGKRAPRGPKRGHYLLRKNDGTESIARLKTVFFLKPIPRVIIDRLVIIGGMIGAFLGVAAAYINRGLFGSRPKGIARYGLTGAVTIATVAVSLVLAMFFNLTLRWLDIGVARQFTSETAGFSIMTPVSLTETTRSTETAAGKIEIRAFSGERNGAAYTVGYSVYPHELVAQSDPAAVLAASRDGMISSLGGVLVTDKEVTVAGNPGREFEVTSKTQDGSPFASKSFLLLVGDRLYQVLVITPKGGAISAKMNDFIRSFTPMEIKTRTP